MPLEFSTPQLVQTRTINNAKNNNLKKPVSLAGDIKPLDTQKCEELWSINRSFCVDWPTPRFLASIANHRHNKLQSKSLSNKDGPRPCWDHCWRRANGFLQALTLPTLNASCPSSHSWMCSTLCIELNWIEAQLRCLKARLFLHQQTLHNGLESSLRGVKWAKDVD